MNRSHRSPRVFVWLLLALALFASACADDNDGAGSDSTYLSVREDEVACVYGDDDREGRGFIKKYTSEDVGVTIEEESILVTVPLSARFLKMDNTASRDPGAPQFITGFAAGDVPVLGMMQIRFRFAGGDPCGWVTDHGLRNAGGGEYFPELIDPKTNAAIGVGDQPCASLARGDLGFNARGRCLTPWFPYLAENFAALVQRIAPEMYSAFEWRALVYNHIVEGERTWATLEGQLSERFTKELNGRLAGTTDPSKFYFCGVGADPRSVGDGTCPDMEFEILGFFTKDEDLMESQTQLTNANARLAVARDLAETQGQLAEFLETIRVDLQQQADEAYLEALAGEDVALCRALASVGVNCAAYHAAINGTTWYGSTSEPQIQIQVPSEPNGNDEG